MSNYSLIYQKYKREIVWINGAIFTAQLFEDQYKDKYILLEGEYKQLWFNRRYGFWELVRRW